MQISDTYFVECARGKMAFHITHFSRLTGAEPIGSLKDKPATVFPCSSLSLVASHSTVYIRTTSSIPETIDA